MKKLYTHPEIKITASHLADIITTSGDGFEYIDEGPGDVIPYK